jgi:uncharacterized protein YdeI (YjbR/CyaY-like superfamily)
MNAMPPENSFHPEDRAAWRAWLALHYSRTEGIWLIMWKKNSGKPQIAYDELVEEALCFGWIDSKPKKLDSERWMLWFAPRKPRTAWSRLNKIRINRAIDAGRMTPAGLTKVEAAKKDGSWNALDAVDALELPQDLVSALASHSSARENFEKFPRSVKRGILEWISRSKTSDTRIKRISETARRAAVNERVNQWRKQ